MTVNPRVIVTPEQVEDALNILTTNDVANTRGDMLFAEHMIKHTRALLATLSGEKTMAGAERAAESSPRYVEKVESYRQRVVDFEVAKAKREHAVAVIDVWRTQQATFRSSSV